MPCNVPLSSAWFRLHKAAHLARFDITADGRRRKAKFTLICRIGTERAKKTGLSVFQIRRRTLFAKDKKDIVSVLFFFLFFSFAFVPLESWNFSWKLSTDDD